jgi:predicted MFS family arabinose efflux permease
MFAYFRSTLGVLMVGVVFGIAQGLLYPTMNALVADWSSPRNIGRTQSIFSGSFGLGIHLCAYFFGGVVETHGYGTMFMIAFGITLIGMAVFVLGTEDAHVQTQALAATDRPGEL